jgi:predicted permease
MPRSGPRIRKDVDEEIRFDVDMRARELMERDGLSESDATARALQEFGNLEATQRYCAVTDEAIEGRRRRSDWFDDLRKDAALALRSIRGAPGFASIVLLTLAIGIGANAAIYSVVRRILIDQLPYRDAGALVRVYAGVPPTGGSEYLTAPELRDLSRVPSFDAVGAFGMVGGAVTYQSDDGIAVIPVASVTPNFFSVLGVGPVAGRSFGDADVGPDASTTAIISYDVWQRVFKGDRSIVGRSVSFMGGTRLTIVGVMPREFVSPGFTADLWKVIDTRQFLTPARAMYRGFRAVARLRAGTTTESTASQLSTLAARWRSAGLIRQNVPAPTTESLRDAMVGDVRPALFSVMAAAVLLLVIACTNVAGLFLARATSRRRELAVRIALGAGRGRLVRQLLTESALYGLCGGALGVMTALAIRPSLVRIANSALPNLGEIRIDLRLVAAAFTVSFLCSLAFGVIPAFAATRVDVKEAMGDAGRGASAGRRRSRVRHLLVAAQIALAVLLMVGAGLLLRSFSGLVRTHLGYSADPNVLIFSIDAPAGSIPDPMSRAAFFSDATARLHAIPGVSDVGVTSIGPWNGPNGATLRDPATRGDAEPIPVDYLTANDGYFAAMGTRIIRGRGIVATDRPGAAPVIVLSEGAVQRVFGSEDPIGKYVIVGRSGTDGGDPHQVVGIAEDYRPRPTREPVPAAYVSDWQASREPWAQFIVRTTGDRASVMAAIRETARQINPAAVPKTPRSMDQIVRTFLAPQRLSLGLFATFASLALTLAALGVYAVMSYLVAARAREFGIRSALGAQRWTLVAMVLRQGMMSAAFGIVVGLSLARAGAELIASLLYRVSAHDGLTFALAPAALLGVVLLACAFPAYRSTRVNPVDALRSE